MSQNLEGLGFTVVPFGQGFEDMSPPSKELMKLALEHRLAHGGHPVLAWMADNVTIRQDPAGNIKLDKQNSTEKIDGIVALVMALDRAIRGGSQPPDRSKTPVGYSSCELQEGSFRPNRVHHDPCIHRAAEIQKFRRLRKLYDMTGKHFLEVCSQQLKLIESVFRWGLVLLKRIWRMK